MESFYPNGPLYKVMWAAAGTNIIWNMEQEATDATCATLVSLLNKYLDVPAWVESYEDYYHRWLAVDDATIYDLGAPVVATMLDAIKRFNRQERYNLYYWFDIDRTESPNFHWLRSPISGETLKELPSSFSAANRYLAPTDSLVFPADSSL
jgi:hypothetical protein